MRLQFLILIAVTLVSSSCSTLFKQKESFQLRPYSKIQLSNGLKVTLIPDKKLPYFSLKLLIYAGSVNGLETKKGVATLTAGLLNKGTKSKRALALADALDQKGSSFSAATVADYTRLEASSLSLHKEELLALFSDMLQNSVFSQRELNRYKKQMVSSIKKTVDKPSSLVRKAYGEFVYGAHPYGQLAPSIASINSIQRADVLNFYNKYYNANNADLVVVGDFGKDIQKSLEKHFGNWKTGSRAGVKKVTLESPKAREVLLVTKKDLKQSQVVIGHPSISRNHPDYLKLKVAATILGRGFSSRLMKEIRVKRGLTYGIGAYFQAQKLGGAFNISTFSRNEKVGEIVTESLNVLTEMVDKGITQEELDVAQGLLKGGFPQIIETAEDLASNIQLLNFYGVGVDYLKNYIHVVGSFTVSDINKAIKKHMSGNKIRVVVFAPRKTAYEQLKKVGEVKIKPYTDFLK